MLCSEWLISVTEDRLCIKNENYKFVCDTNFHDFDKSLIWTFHDFGLFLIPYCKWLLALPERKVDKSWFSVTQSHEKTFKVLSERKYENVLTCATSSVPLSKTMSCYCRVRQSNKRYWVSEGEIFDCSSFFFFSFRFHFFFFFISLTLPLFFFSEYHLQLLKL